MDRIKRFVSDWGFIGGLCFTWLFYVLFIGWFKFLFLPKSWSGVISDVEARYIKHTYNYHQIKALRRAIHVNRENAVIHLTVRQHPFYPNNEYLYIKSSRYNSRVWDDMEVFK